MLNRLPLRLYVANLVIFAALMLLNVVDMKTRDWATFYPNGHATWWTWALWTTMTIAAAPWFLAFVVLVTVESLRRTVGLPSEMQLQRPVLAQARAFRRRPPHRLQRHFPDHPVF